jgi:hypothetical protein
MGLTGLATAWVTITGLAFISIKKRPITQHKEWMIRSHVTTFGFVSLRILVGVLTAANVGSLIDRLAAASWFCWAFPLLVTELILQGKKSSAGIASPPFDLHLPTSHCSSNWRRYPSNSLR